MPVDPITATAVVSFISRYLSKMGESAAGKLGEAAADAAGKVLVWLRSNLFGRAREALDDLEKAPTNEDNQADLRKQLAKLLEAEPSLAAELHALLPKEAIEQGGAMVQTVSGAGAKAQQVRGTGNQTNIS